MKPLFFRPLVLAAGILALAAQSSNNTLLIPIWNGQQYVYAKLGANLSLANGTLSASVATPPARHYGLVLQYDSTQGGWPLPAGAANIVVYVNGLRYTAALDYSISGGVLKSLGDPVNGNMLSTFLVVADYDQ